MRTTKNERKALALIANDEAYEVSAATVYKLVEKGLLLPLDHSRERDAVMLSTAGIEFCSAL